MLFMCIGKYEPRDRNEIVDRRLKSGGMLPEGIKLIGEWSAIETCLVYRVVETDNPEALYKLGLPWSDLIKMQIVPVMETEEAMKSAK